ncbi:MAG: gliding motility-associated C-terminal domain-containing protein [Bacteroidota bacterium]
MKRSLLLCLTSLLLLLYTSPAFSQCGSGGMGCSSAGTVCFPVQGVLPSGQAGATFPGCPANSLDNPVWYAVEVLSAGIVVATITPTNCPGTNGATGAQSGFYEDCNPNSTPFGVQCGCTTGGMSHTANITVPGIYYIMMDGCAGDECEYEINVSGDIAQVPLGSLFPPGVTPLDPCPGEIVQIDAAPVAGADGWNWSLPGGTVIISDPPFCESITVIWGPNSGNVSYTVSNGCGDNGTSMPTPVTVPEFEGFEFGAYCINDEPGYWHAGSSTYWPAGSWEIPLFTARGCDSTVMLEVQGFSTQPNFVLEQICEGEETCPLIYGIFDSPTDSTFVLEMGSLNGYCDSTTNIEVIVVSTSVAFDLPDTLDCNNVNDGILLTANGSAFIDRVSNPTTTTSGLDYSFWTTNGNLGSIVNNTVTIFSPGTYYVEVSLTGPDGECGNGVTCSIIDSIEVVGNFNFPELNLAPTNVSCGGGNDGVASVTINAGTGEAPFTYLWSDAGASTSSTISGLTAGWYYVTVNGDNGCETIDSIQIIEPTPVTLAEQGTTDAGCGGQADGSGTVAASGGTPTYTYTWPASANNQSGPTAINLPSGSYIVTVSDQNSCSATVEVTISEPSTIDAVPLSVMPSCDDASDGVAYVTTANGTPPYTYSWGFDNTLVDSVATGVSAGTYTVTISDQTGCNEIIQIVVDAPTAVSAAAVPSAADCFGAATGSATITPDGGTPGYSYTWPAATSIGDTPTGTGLPADMYIVTVTDDNGCSFEVDFEITEPDELVLSEDNVEDATCNGELDGQAVVSAIGGSGTYTYNWSNGSVGRIVSGLGNGVYTVTVTDVSGCTDEISITIGQPDPLVVSETLNAAVDCFNGNNGASTISVSGGTGPYNYNWSEGTSTTEVSTDLRAGSHTVVVTDANGCDFTIPIEITQPDPLVVQPDILTPAECFGTATASIAVVGVGGTPNYSYLWSDPGAQTMPTATGLAAGTYTVTITDANLCTAEVTMDVTEPDDLALNIINASDVNCFGGSSGSATVSALGGSTPYTYAWPGGAGTATVSDLVAGIYVVTVIDDNGCTETVSVNIGQPNELFLSEDVVTDALCNGTATGSASVTASGGSTPYTFNFSDGVNQYPGQSVNNLPAGTYTVTVRDGRNCAQQIDVVIGEPAPLALAETGNSDVLCFGDATGSSTVEATGGTGPYTYNWSFNAQAGATASLPVGTHTAEVTDANGCTTSIPVNIGQPNELTLAPGAIDDAECFGTATGTASVVAGGGTPNYTYAWSNGMSGDQVTGLTFGTYIITVTDENGCTEEVSLDVGEPTELTATAAPDDASCNGLANGQVTVTPTGGTPPYMYDIGNGAVMTNVLTGLGANSYNITVMDANGCTFNVPAVVGEPIALEATASSTAALCFGSSDGTATASVTGGSAPYAYVWPNGQTTETATGLPSGPVTVDVTDANGCTTEATVMVDQPTEVSLAMSQVAVLCKGESTGSASVVANGGTPPYTYNWMTNGSADATATGLPTGMATVVVTDNNGCVMQADIMVEEPDEELGLNLIGIVAATCGEANGSVDIEPTGGTAPYSYVWSDAGGTATQDIAGVVPGNYTVTITDANGCDYEEEFGVTEPDALQIDDIATVNVSCKDGSDGVINVSIIGGNPPYVFSWNNGGVDQNLNGLVAGTYTIVVTDGDDCSVTEDIEITEPDELVIDDITPSLASCGLSDGTVSISVAGGTGAYSYSWSNGTSEQNATNVPQGNYCVTVTDENGCTVESCAQVDNPNPPSLTEAHTDVNCKDGTDGTITLTINGGQAPYQYAWTGGLTGDDQNALPAGTYTVTVTDAVNCTDEVTITIAEPATSLEVADDDIVLATCGDANGSIAITASGGTTPYSYLWSNGSADEDITTLTPGTYDVTVTDANGCTIEGSYNVSEPNALQIDDKIPTHVLCNGGDDGAIDLVVIGGNTPYIYDWSNGMVTEDISDLTAGVYIVVVTDADGCTVETSVTITEPDELTVESITPSLASCGLADGNISMSVIGGTMPYTYVWDNGAAPVEDPTGLIAQTYNVTITDFNGCTVESSAEVINPNAPEAAFASTDVLCFGQNNGTITVNVQSGTPPYTYAWSNGSIESSPNDFVAGLYSVTVTDAVNCSDVISDILIEQPDALALTLDDLVEAVCGLPNGQVSVTMAGGTEPYDYTWSDGSKLEDRNDLFPGSYDLVIVDANGCELVESFTVVEPNALIATGVVSDVNCNGGTDGSINVSTSGGNTPYSYVWSSGETTESIANKPIGTYILTVTDGAGCTFTLSQTIDEPTAIDLATSPTFATCNLNNGSIDLTVNGGVSPYTFAWSGGTGPLPPVEDPGSLFPGTYVVIVTDFNGCTATTSQSVSEPGALELSSDETDASCNGDANGSIRVTATGGQAPYTYAWSNGPTTQNIDGLPAGTYTVSVTDADDCVVTLTAIVDEPAPLVPLIDVPFAGPSCNGFSDASINISVVGGTMPYSFQWDNGAGVDQNPTGLPAGTYNVTVTDDNGCTAVDFITLVEPDPIEVVFDIDDATCFGLANAAIDVSVTGGTVGLDYEYNWSGGLDPLQDQSEVLAGLYSLTVTDDNGCEEIVAINVDQPTAVDIEVTETSDNGAYNISCHDATDGFARVEASGGTAPYTYLWPSGSSSTTDENLSAGTHVVTVVDANGCEAILPVELTAPAPIDVDALAVGPTCFDEGNGFISFESVQGGTGPYVYSVNDGPFTALPRFGNLDGGDYALRIQDANGCEWSEDVNLVEPEELIVSLSSEDDDGLISFGDDTRLSFDVNSTNFSFEWTQGIDSTNIASTNPIVTPLSTTTYSIQVVDENGCRADDLLILQVNKERPVYIPNVFSPNGDGVNDRMSVYARPDIIKNIDRFAIFDRWGEIVYERRDFQPMTGNGDDPDGWDGFFKGERMDPAVFVYVIEITFIDDWKEVFQGDLTLAR